MKSVLTAVCAVAILVGACGSDEADFVEQLGEIGIPEDQARCVVDELESRGLSVQDVSDQAVGDGDMPQGAAEAVQVCLLGGALDDVDPATLDLDLPDLDLPDLDLPDLDMSDLDTTDLDLTDSGVLGGNADVYGDDPTLDALWDSCAAGDGAACDELYWTSPLGSRYEDFGNTCGDRNPEGVLSCDNESGGAAPSGGDISMGGRGSNGYGDDPTLDALWDSCAAGDGAACDELYWTSPLGSRYEDFGNTCGDRNPEGVLSCDDAVVVNRVS